MARANTIFWLGWEYRLCRVDRCSQVFSLAGKARNEFPASLKSCPTLASHSSPLIFFLMDTHSKIRFGTCSWKYDSWEGLVYSGKEGRNLLAQYSRRYDTVEVDQWFWSLLDKDVPVLPRSEMVQIRPRRKGSMEEKKLKVPERAKGMKFPSNGIRSAGL